MVGVLFTPACIVEDQCLADRYRAWGTKNGFNPDSNSAGVGAAAGSFIGPLGKGGGGSKGKPGAPKAPTTSSNAQILAGNLAKAGSKHPVETSAHHIVASTAKRADPARGVLAKYRIDINDAVNGVYLPTGSKSANPNNMSVHSKIHTNDYYAYVNDMMAGARNRGEAIDVLSHIRRQLQGGYWP